MPVTCTCGEQNNPVANMSFSQNICGTANSWPPDYFAHRIYNTGGIIVGMKENKVGKKPHCIEFL